MALNGRSRSGFLRLCGVDVKKDLLIETATDEEWADVMRLENECDCYLCGNSIAEKTTIWPLQENGYGFVWGSDGVYPDNASAMYACFNCRNAWIDPPEEEE